MRKGETAPKKNLPPTGRHNGFYLNILEQRIFSNFMIDEDW